MHRLNFGPKAERFAMRPPEADWPINILEGAVRSGKTWCLHPKALYCSRYQVGGHKILTGVTKQSIYNNFRCSIFSKSWDLGITTITGLRVNFGCSTPGGL